MSDFPFSTDNPATLPSLTAEQLVQLSAELGSKLAEESAFRDAERRLPFDIFGRIRQLRLGALRVPTAWGGAGGCWQDVVRQYLSLARGDASVAQAFLGHVVFVERLMLMGTPEQQRRFLPPSVARVCGASCRPGLFRRANISG